MPLRITTSLKDSETPQIFRSQIHCAILRNNSTCINLSLDDIMSDIDPSASWRDSARSTRLWIFNSSTTFPLLLWLFNIQTWTFVLAITVMAFFLIIEYYGFTPIIFARYIRSLLAGKRRISRPWWLV